MAVFGLSLVLKPALHALHAVRDAPKNEVHAHGAKTVGAMRGHKPLDQPRTSGLRARFARVSTQSYNDRGDETPHTAGTRPYGPRPVNRQQDPIHLDNYLDSFEDSNACSPEFFSFSSKTSMVRPDAILHWPTG